MNHSFNVEIATQYGIEKAILIENFYFWVSKNKANNKNIHDGVAYTYNSAEAFAELFPYMTARRISKLLRELEEDGLIISRQFGKYNRTKSYTLSDRALHFFVSCNLPKHDNETYQNMTMDSQDKVCSLNTDINTDINTDVNTYKETQDKPAKSQKNKHGEYKHVLLTSDEYQRLCEEWGEQEVLRMIKILDEGIETKGYKYKNHNLALRKWKANEKRARPKTIWNDGTTDADTSEYEAFF